MGCNGLQWVAERRPSSASAAVGPARNLGYRFTRFFWTSNGVLDLAVGGVLSPGGQLPHVGEDKVQRGSLSEPEGRGFLYARRNPGVSKGSAKPVVALRRSRSRGPMCPRG